MYKKIKKRIDKKKAKREAKLREQWRVELIERYTCELFPDLTVANGAFKGMVYPGAISVGSSFFPKLLGSYESELSDIIELIIGGGYTDIVDIGCAEGYYAVGLGICIPSANIYAYDTNQQAVQLCENMAYKNRISPERMQVGGHCDSDLLKTLPLSGRALILCDCEGYEAELFTSELLPFLQGHDLLIETHDCFDINISKRLEELFCASHNITNILSVDDIQKAKTYEYSELEGCSLEERRVLLAEGRSSIQEWLYMKSKKSVGEMYNE